MRSSFLWFYCGFFVMSDLFFSCKIKEGKGYMWKQSLYRTLQETKTVKILISQVKLKGFILSGYKSPERSVLQKYRYQ